MALAAAEQRLLLTEDKDFGWLAFVSRAESEGVVLIRFPANQRESLAAEIEALVARHGEALYGCFTVLQPGYVRVSSRPGRSK